MLVLCDCGVNQTVIDSPGSSTSSELSKLLEQKFWTLEVIRTKIRLLL